MWYRRFKLNVSGFLKLSLWSFLKGTRTGTRNPSAGTGTALDIPRRKNMGQISQEEHGTNITGRTWDRLLQGERGTDLAGRTWDRLRRKNTGQTSQEEHGTNLNGTFGD